MGEYEFKVDGIKNRLYARLEGFFEEADASRVIEALKKTLQEISPDFDVVTDLSRFKPASPGAAQALGTAAELVMAHGRRRAVRITGDSATAMMQFDREFRSIVKEDTVRYATSVEEADRILDEWA